MFRHLQEDAVSGTPTGERARSGGSGQADLFVARPAPAGADSSHLRLSAFRFLRFSFVLSSLRAMCIFILPRANGGGGPPSCAVAGSSDLPTSFRRQWCVESDAPSTILLRKMVPLPRYRGAGC